MATTTPNFGLRKPTIHDRVDVDLDIAANMDLIDSHAHSGTYVGVSGGDTKVGTNAADVVLALKGVSGQSAQVLQVLRASDSAVRFAVKDDGSVVIGKASPSYRLDVESSSSATSGSTNFGEQHLMFANPGGASTGSYYAAAFTTNYNSSDGDTTGSVGGIKAACLTSTKRADTAMGVDATAESTSSDTSALTTSLYAVRMRAKNTGTGRITHAIGWKVNTPDNNGTVDICFGGYIADMDNKGTANSALHIEGAGEGNAITFSGGNGSSLNAGIYSSAAEMLDTFGETFTIHSDGTGTNRGLYVAHGAGGSTAAAVQIDQPNAGRGLYINHNGANNALYVNAGSGAAGQFIANFVGQDYGPKFSTSQNSGNTLLLQKDGTGAGTVFRLINKGTGVSVQIDAGSSPLFSITAAGLLQWSASGNEQTTVGAAGAASALPATPTKYLKVKDSAGTTLVIPAYAAS